MSVLTGGYPAEYGRKLGGVIEVVTAGDARQGFHGRLVASGGSFGTASGYAISQYGWGRNTLSVSTNLADTDRYLDPPVEENFTNSGTGSNVSAHFERELTDADRLGVIMRHGQTSFLVPNERLQQEAGQRQDRNSQETVGQFSYQHIFSANVLGDLRGLVRDLSAGLSSNPLATPILAQQDRGFRELYLKGTVAAHIGRHEWKAGGDADLGAAAALTGKRDGCLERAGLDQADVDAEGLELPAQRLAEALDRVLGGRVHAEQGEGDAPGEAGDVDDALSSLGPWATL